MVSTRENLKETNEFYSNFNVLESNIRLALVREIVE